MKKIICLLPFFLVSLCYTQSVFDPAIAKSETILEEIIQRADIVGLSITVGYQDSLVFSKGYGFADTNMEIKAQPYHKFRVYSLSKHVAAIAAAKLAENGKLDLDLPIGTYMPLIHENLHGITARQLIGHTSGIRAYKDGEWQQFADAACQSPFEAMLLFQADPLEFEPGTEFGYTTYGYVVLSALIEKLAGQPFMDFINTALFDPVGITNVTLDNADLVDHLAAKPYEYWQEVMYNARYANNTCKFGGGGLSASTVDMVHFNLGLLHGKVVRPETLELIFTSLTKSNGEATRYGFGLEFSTDEKDRKYAWHSGRSRGGRNALVIYPQDKLVVCLSTNTNGDSIVKEAEAIAQAFVNALEK